MEDYRNRNTLEHRLSGRYYTMTERDGKFYQRRYQIGFDGKETNSVEKQADFVIGSGNHDFSNAAARIRIRVFRLAGL